MSDKTRYSDEELQEFKELILQKLDKAQKGVRLSPWPYQQHRR